MHWSRAMVIFLGIGSFLAILGPFGTVSEPFLRRAVFWLIVIPAGGMIGRALDRHFRDIIASPAPRILLTAVVSTVPTVAITLSAMMVVLGHQHGFISRVALNLLWQVVVITVAVLGVLWLVERPPRQVVQVRTVFSPPIPEHEAPFRLRLSAKLRTARLLALEAHDHYVRVHTDAGSELLSVRFSDAVAELEGVHGFRVHRSWWVSAAAVNKAVWKRGSGRVELQSGLVAPVSRSGAPALRDAGWL